ncbi:hypothetical protein CUMW_122500 [Citrus unshiu]|uniref:Lipoxygenase domain-containing protein n=1 Tax=Citrus unshiu TaxID=55188 RepID=A0A2H5PBZ4_CITUN|nr:hypothetical protein CUMW_122500 [Citrus unshiu]
MLDFCTLAPWGDENRADDIYVPRDEAFSDIKLAAFDSKKTYSFVSTLPTLIETKFDGDKKFEYFTEIDELFDEDGFSIPPNLNESIWNIIPRWIRKIKETGEQYLQFETPEALHRDKFFWFRDEEFARQTLARLNPCSIQLITAIQQKKLFILDYHDLFLPYVEKVRHIEDEDEALKTTLYGSRTIFFLNPDDTLRPVAIELTRPPMDGKPFWRKVYTPSWNSTDSWLWRLAKAHVLAHDAGYHQLVSHWLSTHCVVEPYVIATNRQLSVIHPIYRLLHPHFRYTVEINAFARKDLVNAGGIIESTFSPGKYSMELSSVAYDKQWRFDHEALPKNLISRRMAAEDPCSPHGLKLTIEDYPYAKDGLDLWDILKKWVTDYVNHYYPNQSLVESDEELQAWWTEIRTVGHGDKEDEPWWPVLKTPQDLIETITTIIWVTSGQHAAVNFGQYTYAGYFPNRPAITRLNMPDEDKSNEIWKIFNEKPDNALLHTFPNPTQATKVMLILSLLSCHSPDEEFLGKDMEPAWGEDPEIKVAFEEFRGRLMELEGTINERNGDINLKNRNGAGVVPYNLLKPFWKDGDKEKGVPYSISI